MVKEGPYLPILKKRKALSFTEIKLQPKHFVQGAFIRGLLPSTTLKSALARWRFNAGVIMTSRLDDSA